MRKLPFLLGTLFFFLASCSSSKVSSKFKLLGEAEPFPGLKATTYEHLKSGLKIVLVPQEDVDVVAYVTSFNVGSRYEVKGKTGLAHLFEHMMFRGTPSFAEPFKILASWGGENNAYTSFDLTQYYVVVPEELTEKVIQFEAERMRKLILTDEIFKTERGAVVSERKMRYQDTPNGKLWWELFNTAFDKHSYKTLAIGHQEDLDKSSLQDALDFYKRFYAPNRATVVVAGNFNSNKILSLVEKNYGSFERETFEEPVISKEPLRNDFRRKVFPGNTQSTMMVDAWLGYDNKSTKTPAAALMCALYASGGMGYLHYELVEKSIAKTVGGDCFPGVDPGLNEIFVTGVPGVKTKDLESAYEKASSGFKTWLNQERLEKMKLYFLSGQWSELRSPLGVASDMARMATTQGDPFWSYKFLDDIKKVSLADVLAEFNARRFNRTRIFVEPKVAMGVKGNTK